ncbi:DUF2268 domain-containing putative Zn-dependent protease [Chryseobacterium sp.]|uniref:DUF2268 domain-containing putative Zn-dependent protease n=1 Tax=Chryseobacterium sp. TaxID=1871047 RepID=UPI0025B9B7B2|nr:DUF2268 domain-containing putative Zn-dependent protease [Chryseobacterium sp.]MBV8326558.1 hypothetical protein [Chryseobacterium sp.]
MKLLTHSLITVALLAFGTINAQFTEDPLNAILETKDAQNFWKAFDKMETSTSNPFVEYIENGSPGVKSFIKNRIINADSLYVTVKENKEKYLTSRNILHGIAAKDKKLKASYSALKYWYPNAKFSTVYFVYGRMNTGGNSSNEGISIGTELFKNLDGVVPLIVHEMVHFQQNNKGNESLLKQALTEGGADFIGEFVSGEPMNEKAFQYGEAHSDELYREFVTRYKSDDLRDWFYWTSQKDDRPNDLGYWIGYKICEAYFNKQTDKHKAVYDILNIEDPFSFLQESGFLDSYIQAYAKEKNLKYDDFFKEFSGEPSEVTIVVNVPDKNDEVYMAGNQKGLGNWSASSIKMERKSDLERALTLQIYLPAQLKFTKGNWNQEANVKGLEKGQNIRIENRKSKKLTYKITSWFKN